MLHEAPQVATPFAVQTMLFLLVAFPLLAQLGGAAVDPRVARQLKAAGLDYTVDSDGDYRVLLTFDDERSQVVFVNSETEFFQGMEIREVWSIAARFEGTVPQDLARALLEQNARLKFGAWSVETSGTTSVVVFRVHLDANTDGKTLRAAIEHVGIVADELEKELSEADDF